LRLVHGLRLVHRAGREPSAPALHKPFYHSLDAGRGLRLVQVCLGAIAVLAGMAI